MFTEGPLSSLRDCPFHFGWAVEQGRDELRCCLALQQFDPTAGWRDPHQLSVMGARHAQFCDGHVRADLLNCANPHHT